MSIIAESSFIPDDVVYSKITYISDGLKVTGAKVSPENPEPESLPMVIYNRGGNRDCAALNIHIVIGFLGELARKGNYGILASNYRGNAGGEGKEEFGGADINDVFNLIEIGKTQPWWDRKNIFMIGWSRGGMMTYIAIKLGVDINAAVVGGGLTDLFASSKERPDMEKAVHSELIPNWKSSRDEVYKERSAIYWADKINVPVLILHGAEDAAVSVNQAKNFAKELDKYDKKYSLKIFEKGEHGLAVERNQVIADTVNWFSKFKK